MLVTVMHFLILSDVQSTPSILMMLFDDCSRVMRSVVICAVDQMLLGVQIKVDDMGGGM